MRLFENRTSRGLFILGVSPIMMLCVILLCFYFVCKLNYSTVKVAWVSFPPKIELEAVGKTAPQKLNKRAAKSIGNSTRRK
jgi:hypothetical protein